MWRWPLLTRSFGNTPLRPCVRKARICASCLDYLLVKNKTKSRIYRLKSTLSSRRLHDIMSYWRNNIRVLYFHTLTVVIDCRQKSHVFDFRFHHGVLRSGLLALFISWAPSDLFVFRPENRWES